jgi:HD superfamily phosphohydrolase
MKSKTIRDPIHGDIKLEGLFLDLIEAPEIQRLYNVKQLGFAHLVFPGAHHTRLEHSLGAYHVATKATEKLNLKKDESELVACAAMLHDIGHGPFSHTLEYILRETLNVDHVDLTEKLIRGEHKIFDESEKDFVGSKGVFDILERREIDHKIVADLIRGNECDKPYLGQILNSSIDVDQLDYLIRDAYYTGVAYGMIDIERFLQTLLICDNNLAVKKKGVGVVENILMARTLMYSSVYFHKTVRIAELMLSKAIEMVKDADPFEFFKMTDVELISELKKMGTFQHEIVSRLKYRKLFKQAYFNPESELNEESKEIIKKLEDVKLRNKKEQEFEETFDIPSGHIIIDIPSYELHQAEPRIDKTDIVIFDGKNMKNLDDLTPVAGAVRSRVIPDWTIMIVCDDNYREIVSKNAKKILFG